MFKNKLLILTIGLYINIFAFDGVCLVNGQYYENNKEYKKAFEHYLKGAKKNVVNCMIEASKFYTNEDFGIKYQPQKAYELLSKAVKIEPYNSLIHYNLGILHFKLKENDMSRYHFIFAYILGDKDAKEYIVQMPIVTKIGYIKEVSKKDKFDMKLLAQRVKYFSNNIFKETSQSSKKYLKSNLTFEPKIVLKSNNNLEITIYQNKIILDGCLTPKNATLFGIYIQLVQRAIYVDIPKDILMQTDKKFNKLMTKTLNSKSDIEVEFKSTFKHQFSFSNITQYMKYKIIR